MKPETYQRLSDHISIGVLTQVFSPELVDRIVTESGRTEKRHRLLRARVVVYYVLGLALFSDSSYEEVMRTLVEGLSWTGDGATSCNAPTKAALFTARATRCAAAARAVLSDCHSARHQEDRGCVVQRSPTHEHRRDGDENHGNSPESITEIPHLVRAVVGH